MFTLNPHPGWLTLLATCLVAGSTVVSADDNRPLNIICFGAHPDDAEYKSGGTASMWAAKGHRVKLVSVTNGDIGHWQMAGGPLAQRRTAERFFEASPHCPRTHELAGNAGHAPSQLGQSEKYFGGD